MRKYDNYTNSQKHQSLILALAFALTATDAKRKAASIYELAAENGKISGLRPEDFDLIKGKTIEEIVREIS